MRPKKVCVIGAGRWGMNHVRTLSELGVLGGVVDSRLEILEKLKLAMPHVFTSTSLDAAINAGFDGFVVATPAETHFEVATEIIDSGHHVLVEKPVTLTVSDAVSLRDRSLEMGVNVMVGHVLLFHPAFKKIKHMLADGLLGDIQYLYSNRLNLGTIRNTENVFWSFAPHDIALFQDLVRRSPVSLNSTGLDAGKRGIHDTTLTSIDYGQGTMGHIFVSWLHPFKEHRFVVVGSKGMIKFEDSMEGKPLIFYDKSVNWRKGLPTTQTGATWHIEYEPAQPLSEELKYFLDHLDGSPLKIAGIGDAVGIMKVLESATQSLQGQLT